jgi:chromate transporter
MLFYQVPFPWIVLAALGLGAVKHLASPMPTGRPSSPSRRLYEPEVPAAASKVPWKVIGLGLVAWWAPVALAVLVFGWDSLLASLGFFFSKVAVVTFGGAYAVLPYVADHAVNGAGWLSAAAMKDGLALAEALPGPLVKVLQFAGFMAGWNNAAPLSPWIMATLGALITSWVTFVPSFLFILAGAPFVERLSDNPRAKTILDSVTAAVIGVIANLAAWFAGGIFAPGQPSILHAVIAGVNLWLLIGRSWSIPVVVGVAAVAGLLRVVV